MAPSLKSSIDKRNKALADMQAMLPSQQKKTIKKPVVKEKVAAPVKSAFSRGGSVEQGRTKYQPPWAKAGMTRDAYYKQQEGK